MGGWPPPHGPGTGGRADSGPVAPSCDRHRVDELGFTFAMALLPFSDGHKQEGREVLARSLCTAHADENQLRSPEDIPTRGVQGSPDSLREY